MGELTSKKFWADVVVRAIRTMAQTAIGVIGTAAAMSDVKWGVVASSVFLSGLSSVLMSLDRIETTQNGGNGTPSIHPERRGGAFTGSHGQNERQGGGVI